MRPQPRSVLTYPFDILFGRLANVRVLRALAGHGGYLTAANLVARTALTKPGVIDALRELDGMGIAESAGSGQAVVYRLSSSHPLSPAIVQLFTAESERRAAICGLILSSVPDLIGRAASVWLYGSFARGMDSAESDLDVALVVESGDVDSAAAKMRSNLEATQDRLAFRSSVMGLSGADVLRLSDERDPWWISVSRDAVVLRGQPPRDVEARLKRGRKAA